MSKRSKEFTVTDLEISQHEHEGEEAIEDGQNDCAKMKISTLI